MSKHRRMQISNECLCSECGHIWEWIKGANIIGKKHVKMLRALRCPECKSNQIRMKITDPKGAQ